MGDFLFIGKKNWKVMYNVKMGTAIKILLDAGYKPAGETNTEVYRTIMGKSYPLPGAEIITGGRLRFEKGSYRVTVGKRTVCLYKMINGKPSNFQNIKTKEFSPQNLEGR